MAGSSGWTALNTPDRSGRAAFHVSAFNRLARVHAASSAADVVVAVALAGSLFFSIDPSQARWRVGLYLLLTLAPFVVVAPESTVDPGTPDGSAVRIEDRGSAEVTPWAEAVNPAFDVTPYDLVTAIVTDRRVIRLDQGQRV